MSATAMLSRRIWPVPPGITQCLAICLMVFLSSASTTPAQAREIRFGAYDEFTLVNYDGEQIKDDVLFVFHGFGSAMPNGAYNKLYNAFAEHFSIIGFNYDYFDLDGNDAAIERVWEGLLKNRNVIFVGTSLGGFWANHYAEKYGVKRVVLVNPVVKPAKQLRQFIGKYRAEKRGKDILVTEEKVSRYASRTSPPTAGIERLIFLSRDDQVLDYQLSENAYSGANNTVIVFDEGGHTVNLNQDRYLDPLRAFLLPSQ